jgi:hypothetical protein
MKSPRPDDLAALAELGIDELVVVEAPPADPRRAPTASPPWPSAGRTASDRLSDGGLRFATGLAPTLVGGVDSWFDDTRGTPNAEEEDVLVSVGLIVVGTAVSVAAVVLTRRGRASRRITYHKSPMAGDIFGVIGTGFTVVLAFVIFTAFESYQQARDEAGVESVATRQMESLTAFFPQQSRIVLQGDLLCYGRAVVHDEWPLMASGRSSPVVDDWVTRIDTALVGVPIQTSKEVEVFNMWLERSDERQEGRRGRLAEALPLIPLFVWGMLVLLLALVIGYQVLFTRANLPLLPQAIGVGATAATLITGMVIVYVLDMPFADRGAALAPIRMQTTVSVLESQYQGSPESIPCDATGRPRS